MDLDCLKLLMAVCMKETGKMAEDQAMAFSLLLVVFMKADFSMMLKKALEFKDILITRSSEVIGIKAKCMVSVN